MNIIIADHIAQSIHFTTPTNHFPGSFTEESGDGRRFKFVRTSEDPLIYQIYTADKGVAWGNQESLATSIRHPNLFVILVDYLQHELFSVEGEIIESWPDEVFTALTLFLLDLHKNAKEERDVSEECFKQIPPELIEQEIEEILRATGNPNLAKLPTPQEVAKCSEEEYFEKLRELGAAYLLKKFCSK